MFPRIPNDPVHFYPVPDPIPPVIDPELLWRQISWKIATDKFRRQRHAERDKLRGKVLRAEVRKVEREEREAQGIFGPMDERYFPKYRSKKHDAKWDCLRHGISRKPSRNYGGGTVIRSVNEARGNTGQLIRREKPTTLLPWPKPKVKAIGASRLQLHKSLHPLVVEEVRKNMANAEAERKKQIPPPHLTGVARAYWLIQMRRGLTRPSFVNPLYDERSELTGKAPDGRIYDSSDYESDL